MVRDWRNQLRPYIDELHDELRNELRRYIGAVRYQNTSCKRIRMCFISQYERLVAYILGYENVLLRSLCDTICNARTARMYHLEGKEVI